MMDVAALLAGHFKPRPPEQDEYLGEDGRIYCRLCHAPRQAKIKPCGAADFLYPPVLCKCQRKERDRIEQEQNRRRLEEQVKKLKLNGLPDRALEQCRFENDQNYTPQISVAKRYVEHFSEAEKSGTGLMLWGNVGTGKTFLAACIANALMEQNIPVLMTNFTRVLNRFSFRESEGWNRLLDSLDDFRLLIIDDLGVERNTAFAMEMMFSIVDRRIQSGRPMIVTTNLPLSKMKNPESIAHARIYDRILEKCMPVRVTGESIRKQLAEERMSAFRSLLEGTSSPQ